MVPLWVTRTTMIGGAIMMIVSLAAFAWTQDSIHLTFAQGYGFPAAVAAVLHQARKKEIAAHEPSPPEAPPARNAMLTALFLLPAAALATLYEWDLYALWTPTVIFVLLFLVFMGLYHATRLTRQLRSTRSPSDGP